MADFCFDCYRKLEHFRGPAWLLVFSEDCELCEGCGKYKQVVITHRIYRYLRFLNFFLFPVKLPFYILGFLLRLFMLPITLYKEKKRR